LEEAADPAGIISVDKDILPGNDIYLREEASCAPISGIRGGRSVKISDFQSKDVVNIVDGKKLGQISDLELDLRQGRIESIVVPNQGRFFGLFGSGTDVVIPWRNIIKIGMDVVLVKLEDTKLYRTSEETEARQEYNGKPHNS